MLDEGQYQADNSGYSGGGSPGSSSAFKSAVSWGTNAPDGPYWAIESSSNKYYGGAGAGNHGGPGYLQNAKSGGNGGGGNAGGYFNGGWGAPTAGTDGLGGGGGGGSSGNTTALQQGGAGGDGLVVVRFGEDLLRDDTHKMVYCSGKISLKDQLRAVKMRNPQNVDVSFSNMAYGNTNMSTNMNSWNGTSYTVSYIPSYYDGSSQGYIGTHYDEFLLSNGVMTFEFNFRSRDTGQTERPVLSLGTSTQHIDIYTDQFRCSVDCISGGSSLGTRSSAAIGTFRNYQMSPMVIIVDTNNNKILAMNENSVIADLGSAYGFSFASSGNKLYLSHNQTRSNSATSSQYAPAALRMIADNVYSVGDTITPLAFPNHTLY